LPRWGRHSCLPRETRHVWQTGMSAPPDTIQQVACGFAAKLPHCIEFQRVSKGLAGEGIVPLDAARVLHHASFCTTLSISHLGRQRRTAVEVVLGQTFASIFLRRSRPIVFEVVVQNPYLLREARWRCDGLPRRPPSACRLPPSFHTRFAGPNSSPRFVPDDIHTWGRPMVVVGDCGCKPWLVKQYLRSEK
jgi:hypothetical protein